MPSAQYDATYLQAGASQIEAYLLSADLFWPIGVHAPRGEMAYPQLTLGGLLLSRRRLQAVSVGPGIRAKAEPALAQLDAAQAHWRVAWERKATAEFSMRLNLWRDFLEEYRENPASNANRYPYESHRRVLLQLLQPETHELPTAYLDLLGSLDGFLKTAFTSGKFIWEASLASAFPENEFWYLYGTINK